MNEFKFNKNYHNNIFSAKLSHILDRKRSIMDIDIYLSKFGCKTTIMIDHKKTNDEASISTLKCLSELATDTNRCFIVRNEIDEKTGEIVNDLTTIYEIKKLIDVSNKGKNKQDYVKNIFELRNDTELALFFDVEKHNEFKNDLLNRKVVY